jgi:hypothetical protein
MAKTLFEVFYDEFAKEIRQAKNYPEAYEKASSKFEERHGFTPYNSYETFRRKKKARR